MRVLFGIGVLVVVMGGVLGGPVIGQEDGGGGLWKVGLAEAKITPEEPVWMSGYASRAKPSEGVAHDLFVKALALTDGQGNRAVLLTSDLIGFRADVSEPICGRVMKELGIERSQILLSSSHTHGGPAVSGKSMIAGAMTQADSDRVKEYTAWLSDQVVEVITEAWRAEPREAVLTYGVGVANFVMNRREVTDSTIRLGTNPRGYADRSVPVLVVTAADPSSSAQRAGSAGASGEKERLAVVFQASAHNTTLGGQMYAIHGDYAGFAQGEVEERFPGVQAMFVTGCAGDTNPHPRGTMEMAQAHGEALGAEVARVVEGGKLLPVGGPLKTVYRKVALPLQPLPEEDELVKLAQKGGGWRRFTANKMVEMRASGKPLPTAYEAPFTVWQLGDDLTHVGLSGEVTGGYVGLIEQALRRENRLWISAYCHEVFGYLPTKRVLAEGGYETRGVYTGAGFFKPEAEDVAVKAVVEMAAEAGRKPGPVRR